MYNHKMKFKNQNLFTELFIILDFGLSKIFDPNDTSISMKTKAGTVNYIILIILIYRKLYKLIEEIKLFIF